MAPAPDLLALSPGIAARRAFGPRTFRQKPLFCVCGRATPSTADLCPRCYRALARSRSYFGGHREAVLARDGFRCRACPPAGTGNPGPALHVHHRIPGRSEPELLITLCPACHARLHRLKAIRRFLPESLVPLWEEQHPGTPRQLQFDLSAFAVAR